MSAFTAPTGRTDQEHKGGPPASTTGDPVSPKAASTEGGHHGMHRAGHGASCRSVSHSAHSFGAALPSTRKRLPSPRTVLGPHRRADRQRGHTIERGHGRYRETTVPGPQTYAGPIRPSGLVLCCAVLPAEVDSPPHEVASGYGRGPPGLRMLLPFSPAPVGRSASPAGQAAAGVPSVPRPPSRPRARRHRRLSPPSP